jgi:hypothetical protein
MGITNLRDPMILGNDHAGWLPRFMIEHGTWNTPIILLSNEPGTGCYVPRLNSPLHLLEGHRRFSVFNVLREDGRVAPFS